MSLTPPIFSSVASFNTPVHDLWHKRFQLEQSVRQFFLNLGYLETPTPLLVMSPGMEPHLRPFQVIGQNAKAFLPTSPEFSMKKLLALGFHKIFQINSAFRDEPMSLEHLPEFRMLEFYETNLNLTELMNRVEALILYLAQTLDSPTSQIHAWPYRHFKLNLTPHWPKVRVNDLFIEHTGVDLRKVQKKNELEEELKRLNLKSSSSDTWDDLYFRIWLNLIEPKIDPTRPLFVTHFPRSQSSLCNPIQDETGFLWANRFELFLGGHELGNAFDELLNPSIQRENFIRDQLERKRAYGESMPESPLDEDLLQSLSHIPPTSGIAIGLDRIFMILLNAQTIQSLYPVLPKI